MTNARDQAFMQMAYGLAEKARGWASPNPNVGAVVTRNDQIIGMGYHEKSGRPHAEIIALRMAGSGAAGGTLYVTLEPCAHFGRTPPCVDSIIRAGIQRVVLSAIDPNPVVNEKGVKKLKEAGIAVDCGLMASNNSRLNEFYIKHITQKTPFTTAKAAVSLDGKMATRTLSSQWISSEGTREYIHALRGEYDALMVGINTIIRDDPQLTVRHPLWKGKNITRVIPDSNLRFPLSSRILKTQSQGKIIILTSSGAPEDRAEKLRQKGAEIIPIPGPARIDLKKALSLLAEREITSLLVEGGGTLLTSFLEKGLLDKLIITLAPKLIGGKTAPGLFMGKGVDRVEHALRLKRMRSFTVDEDIILEGYF